jgi:dTDP-4-dehydrorhamnose reductase
MRILVTGSQGQVGQNLRKYAEEYSQEVIALDRQGLDITDLDSIRTALATYEPALVINAAAYTAVDKAESEVELAYRVNKTGSSNLAVACAEYNLPLFHISTDYVFDGDLDRPYTENDLINPMAVYAASKAQGESEVLDKLDRAIVLRTSWVFSAEGPNFVKTMLRLAADRDQLKVVYDQFGGPTSAGSIARVLLAMASHYEEQGYLDWGIYHFSQKPYVSWYQFACRIIDIASESGKLNHVVEVLPVPSTEYPTTVTRPKNSRLDCSKIEGYLPGFVSSWEQDVRCIINGDA